MTNVCGCHSGGLYIYSAVCMMLRIAILIAGWLSCHRPLWCMTASVHSPRVQTSSAHNISLCRWMADSQVASHGRSSSSTFISCIFHFLHVTYVSLDQISSLFIVITYPYPMWGLPQMCDKWTGKCCFWKSSEKWPLKYFVDIVVYVV